MVRGKRSPIKRKTTTRKTPCRRVKKHTGTMLDDIVENEDYSDDYEYEEEEVVEKKKKKAPPKKKKESAMKRLAKMGLGAATLGLGGYLGYKGLNALNNTDFDDLHRNAQKKIDKWTEKGKKKYNEWSEIGKKKYDEWSEIGKEKGNKFYTEMVAPWVNAYHTTDWNEVADKGKAKAKEWWNAALNADYKGYARNAKNWIDSTIDSGIDMFDHTKERIQDTYNNNAFRQNDGINASIDLIESHLLNDPTKLRPQTMTYIIDNVEKAVKAEDPMKITPIQNIIKLIKPDITQYSEILKQLDVPYGKTKIKDLYRNFGSLRFEYNKIIR